MKNKAWRRIICGVKIILSMDVAKSRSIMSTSPLACSKVTMSQNPNEWCSKINGSKLKAIAKSVIANSRVISSSQWCHQVQHVVNSNKWRYHEVDTSYRKLKIVPIANSLVANSEWATVKSVYYISKWSCRQF